MRRSLLALIAMLASGCKAKSAGTVTLTADPPNAPARREEPPVAINADSPMEYPDALAAQALSGTVVLKLFVDTMGLAVRESTSIAESSGYPALDSAAVLGVPRLRYSPALRDGAPVAASFLQPIHFRAGRSGATIR